MTMRGSGSAPASSGWSGFVASHTGVLVVVPGLVLAVGLALVVLGQSSLFTSISVGIAGRTSGLARESAALASGPGTMAEALLGRILSAKDDPVRVIGQIADGMRGSPLHAVGIVGADGRSESVVLQDEGAGAAAVRGAAIARAAASPGTVVWATLDAARAVVLAARSDGSSTAYLQLALARNLEEMTVLAREMARSPPPEGEAPPAPAGLPAAADAGDAVAVAVLADANGTLVAGSGELARAVVAAVARQLVDAPQVATARLERDAGRLVVAARRLSLPGAPPWYAVVAIGWDSFTAPARAHLHRSLLIGLAMLAAAVAVAVLVARAIARQRQQVRLARAEAADAAQRLREMGAYRLVRRLGEGGMGSVWQAEHRLLARPAAVKLILPSALGDDKRSRDQACARFEREARATAALRSRNTVTLYDYGIADDGSFFYAMEMLDGTDLDRLVARFGPLPQARAVSILVQACRSLIEAHALGMVHRDIKPANIYLCRLGVEVDIVKVLDFGLVVQPASGTRSISNAGFVQGTPACMAPEQARGQAVDARTDIYALGCVAYWLLSGRELFDDATSAALMAAHIARPAPALRAPVHPDLQRLVARMLAKEPGQRPASAADLMAELEAIPCPAGQEWSASAAQAWWASFAPEPVEDDDVAAGSTMLMPVRTAWATAIDAG